MTTKMARKQIYIEACEEQLLKQLVRETEFTEAQLIWQAIDRHTGSYSPQIDMHVWNKERALMESLMRKGPVSGGLAWKREDLHER